MKDRYRLFLRRKSVYYAFDNTTKTFESLKTKDKAFDLIRSRLLIETQAEHFLEVLKSVFSSMTTRSMVALLRSGHWEDYTRTYNRLLGSRYPTIEMI